jgi:hypothetical protein
MADRVYFANGATQMSKEGDPARDHGTLGVNKLSKPPEVDDEGKYAATAPGGTQLEIPKELFIALSDFIKTRKCPGSITIQFRRGEIVCVEAVAKKTYRSS